MYSQGRHAQQKTRRGGNLLDATGATFDTNVQGGKRFRLFEPKRASIKSGFRDQVDAPFGVELSLKIRICCLEELRGPSHVREAFLALDNSISMCREPFLGAGGSVSQHWKLVVGTERPVSKQSWMVRRMESPVRLETLGMEPNWLHLSHKATSIPSEKHHSQRRPTFMPRKQRQCEGKR